jgi:hypothetical protein
MEHTLAMALPNDRFSLLVADLPEAPGVQAAINLRPGTDDYFAHYRPFAVAEHLTAAARA